MQLQEQYRTIVRALILLAASFEKQNQILPSFADVPDDVTSNFENAFLLLPQLIEKGQFSNNSIASILRVYNRMQWCLRNVDLDDFSNKEWNSVRDLAKETLSHMNESFNDTNTL